MDSNTDRFAEAWVNVPHRLLGRRLRPLCLNHLLFLHQAGSPLVLTDREVSMADLEIAALICSGSSAEAIMRNLTRSHSLWRQANRFRDVQRELGRFIAYYDDHCSLPRFNPKGDGVVEEVFPWLLMHCAGLVRATGWRECEVFEMPLGKVVWLNSAFGYLETGRTGVQSDMEGEAIAMLTGRGLR